MFNCLEEIPDQKLILLKDKGLVLMTCEEVFEQFDRFIHYIVLKFKNCMDKDELYQLGIMGLVKAYKGYDADKKILFMTFATHCMENEILMSIRSEKKHKSEESIDVIKVMDSSGNNNLTLESQLSDDIDYEELAINNVTKNDFNEKLDRLLNCLGKRNKEIVILTYYKNMDQYTIAQKLGISQSYVSRILLHSISKLHRKSRRSMFEILRGR